MRSSVLQLLFAADLMCTFGRYSLQNHYAISALPTSTVYRVRVITAADRQLCAARIRTVRQGQLSIKVTRNNCQCGKGNSVVKLR